MNALVSRHIANRGLLRALFASANGDSLRDVARDEHRQLGPGALLVMEDDLVRCWEKDVTVDVMYLAEAEVGAAESMDGLGDLIEAVRRYDPESSFVVAFTGPLGLTVLTCPRSGYPETN